MPNPPRWRDDQGNELPPDPWAHAHEPSTPMPPPAPDPLPSEPRWDATSGDDASTGGPPPFGPPPRRGLLQHPALWIGVVLLALVLLLGALLEGGPRRDPGPSPGSVTAAPSEVTSADADRPQLGV